MIETVTMNDKRIDIIWILSVTLEDLTKLYYKVYSKVYVIDS